MLGGPLEAAFQLWEVAEMHDLKRLQGMCCASVQRNLIVENAGPMLQMAATAAATSSSSSSFNRLRSCRDGGDVADHDDPNANGEYDPLNRLKDICMQFVVQNFASVFPKRKAATDYQSGIVS